MVNIQTAINELNMGAIEFNRTKDNTCTTEGEVVILLERLKEFEAIGLEPDEITRELQENKAKITIPYNIGDKLGYIKQNLLHTKYELMESDIETFYVKQADIYADSFNIHPTSIGTIKDNTDIIKALPLMRDNASLVTNRVFILDEKTEAKAEAWVKILNEQTNN